MNATLEEIAREVLFPPAQREELADFIVESLDATAPDETQRLWMERRRDASKKSVKTGRLASAPGSRSKRKEPVSELPRRLPDGIKTARSI
ncbi:addiction module protein [Methylococcus geothermalis]|uniref:Addiction module component n=1 Tax=Methylococcus geothermalis TaxID=2681310 RepID=A0A858Q7Q0_9GAMM|nr:addiction module protein [Methylococcus geothermalis]QJD29888.1 hypothetical protein GNH96_07810 [Methylococcus geothermalis]